MTQRGCDKTSDSNTTRKKDAREARNSRGGWGNGRLVDRDTFVPCNDGSYVFAAGSLAQKAQARVPNHSVTLEAEQHEVVGVANTHEF